MARVAAPEGTERAGLQPGAEMEALCPLRGAPGAGKRAWSRKPAAVEGMKRAGLQAGAEMAGLCPAATRNGREGEPATR